jgi:hypothetical protein
VEEGQEIMLIEDLQLQKTTEIMEEEDGEQQQPSSSNQDNQQDQEGAQRKSTRKVQQVLLVPTNKDLLMERYRQAAKRSMNARVLLDQALNWDATVVNRDRMAADAFTEAGKARLLIETNKTPELIAMLTDAKVKGEEEACRAQDTKVAKLIPSVKLPTTAARKASASALAPKKWQTTKGSVVDQKIITETPTITNAVMMTKDPAIHCFDNVMYPDENTFYSEVTTFSEEEGDEEADEHVFRAKQYLEFILPDLGEIRGDSSMASKASANPRSILHNYQMGLLQHSSNGITSYHLYSGSEGNGLLGGISSLGFDESHSSHSFDNLSSREDLDEDVFSMTSLNEIMDTPLDEFDAEKILKMSSKQRRKLTIKMSFGSKSMQVDEMIESPTKDEESPTREKPPHMSDATSPLLTSSEGVAAASTSAVAPEKNEASGKKRRSLSFARMRTNATVPASIDEHTNTPGAFLSRFRSMKKSPRRENLQGTNNDVDDVNNLRILGPVLSDLSDGHSQLIPELAQAEQAKPVKSTTTRGGEKAKEPNKQVASEPTVSDQKQHLREPERKPKDETQQNMSPKVRTSIAAVPTRLVNLFRDLEVQQSDSMASPSQSEEDEIEDRYKVSILLCGEEFGDDNETVHQVAPYTPLSLASDQETPSRYSPINCDDTPTASPHVDSFTASASIESHEEKLNNEARVPVVTEITSRTSPEYSANSNLKPSALPEARESPAINPNPENPSQVAAAQETGSHASGTLSSIVPSNSDPKNKKKSRGLIIGMFSRNDKEIPGRSTQHAPPKSKAPPKTKTTDRKSGSMSVDRAETALHDKPNKADKKKRSSQQVSLKKIGDEQKPKAVSAPRKGVGSTSTKTASIPSPSPRKVARISSSPLKRVPGYLPPPEKAYVTSPSPSQAPTPSSSNKNCHRRTSSKASQNSKQGKCTSSPLPLHPKLKSKARETNGSPFKRVSSGQSSLPMALELSREKVEIMAIEEGGPTAVPSLSPLKASENIAAQPRSGKPPVASPAKQIRIRNKAGLQIDKRQLQQANHDAPDVQGSIPKASSSHNSTSWMKNIGFHIKRKGHAKKSNPATSEQNSNLDFESDNNENTPPSAITSNESPTQLALSPLKAAEPTQLTCDTLMPQDTLPVLPTIASNPLLPYQLVKHLEEQHRMSAEMEMSVKEAAERSIIRSTTNAMLREGALPFADHANGFYTISPTHRDEVGCAQMHRPSMSTPGSLPIQSSPRSLGTSNSPSSRNHHHRPDADGLNARPKDVREILVGGLDEDEDLDVMRSRSFLGRITQGAYRQDFDLPDP